MGRDYKNSTNNMISNLDWMLQLALVYLLKLTKFLRRSTASSINSWCPIFCTPILSKSLGCISNNFCPFTSVSMKYLIYGIITLSKPIK